MITKLNLTTRFNIKAVCIISLLMIVLTVYEQFILLQDRKQECALQLEIITDFLVKKMPAESFIKIVEQQAANDMSIQEQVLSINKELQPILSDVLTPGLTAKFGIYSRQLERVVAIGPEYDNSLMIGVNPDNFLYMYEAKTTQFGERKNSILWHGATVLYHLRPIVVNDKVVGHVFSSTNLDTVYAEAWKKAISMFLGEFIVLLIAIMLFQEVFIRLKKDLKLFADHIVNGRGRDFESELPELTAILNHISEQTEKMSRLDRLNTIGEMAAGIGHEVRNPMTTVRGFLQYLSLKPELKDHKEHFSLMINELDRANGIITEFLSLAKDKSMNFKKFNLNRIIIEIIPLLEADALRNNCQIKTNLKNIPDILLDESSIRQLIINMVRNAIEAMPHGGVVTISTTGCGQKVLLALEDQGTGISPELLSKIGTPFFTTKENGTGLGLAICYRIVQRHEATIGLESKPGKGTVFTINFSVPS